MCISNIVLYHYATSHTNLYVALSPCSTDETQTSMSAEKVIRDDTGLFRKQRLSIHADRNKAYTAAYSTTGKSISKTYYLVQILTNVFT